MKLFCNTGNVHPLTTYGRMPVVVSAPPYHYHYIGGSKGVYLVARYSVQTDWLSIVLPIVPVGEGGEQGYLAQAIERAISNEIGENLASAIFSQVQPLGYGRAPYAEGFKDDTKGVTIWAGGSCPHFCIEFSGKGLAYLRWSGTEYAVLESFSPFLSRIDIAIDLEGEISPQEFVKYRKSGKQLTNANLSSPSGDTCYIGSMHSERYMRVYRYSPPHPRSHLLRLEMVFRRAYAKQVGTQVLSAGLDAVAKAGLEDFGFADVVEFEENTPAADLTIYRPERNGGKTLRWIITQVAPAFKKLVSEGIIPNPEEFFWRYFMPESTGDND